MYMPRKKATVVAPPSGLITITQADLDAMVKAAVEASKPKVEGFPVDTTVDLPTGSIPRELIADKSNLPPPEARTSSPAQPPAKLWGQHLQPSPIQHLTQNVPTHLLDARTGNPINQVGPTGGSISPPPSRNFR